MYIIQNLTRKWPKNFIFTDIFRHNIQIVFQLICEIPFAK